MLTQKVTTLNDGTVITHFDDVIGKKLQRTKGFYESGMLNYIRSLGKFDTVLDIGANIGNHTLYLAKYVANNVHAVEPVPNNFKLLEKNVIDNNLLNKVQLHNFGLGKEEGKMYVADINRNMGACDLTSEKIEGANEVSVKQASTFAYKFGLVKIDCESMSFEILEELLPQIKKNKAHVFIEANAQELKKIKSLGGTPVQVFNATPTYHITF